MNSQFNNRMSVNAPPTTQHDTSSNRMTLCNRSIDGSSAVQEKLVTSDHAIVMCNLLQQTNFFEGLLIDSSLKRQAFVELDHLEMQ